MSSPQPSPTSSSIPLTSSFNPNVCRFPIRLFGSRSAAPPSWKKRCKTAPGLRSQPGWRDPIRRWDKSGAADLRKTYVERSSDRRSRDCRWSWLWKWQSGLFFRSWRRSAKGGLRTSTLLRRSAVFWPRSVLGSARPRLRLRKSPVCGAAYSTGHPATPRIRESRLRESRRPRLSERTRSAFSQAASTSFRPVDPACQRTLVSLLRDDLGPLLAKVETPISTVDAGADNVAWSQVLRPTHLRPEEQLPELAVGKQLHDAADCRGRYAQRATARGSGKEPVTCSHARHGRQPRAPFGRLEYWCTVPFTASSSSRLPSWSNSSSSSAVSHGPRGQKPR